MDPQTIVERLCRSFGVSADFGERILPLVEKAMECPEPKRKRLLALVERSFEHEAQRRAQQMSPSQLPPEDLRLVNTVAGLLHGWSPPMWLKLWVRTQKRP